VYSISTSLGAFLVSTSITLIFFFGAFFLGCFFALTSFFFAMLFSFRARP